MALVIILVQKKHEIIKMGLPRPADGDICNPIKYTIYIYLYVRNRLK